MLPQSILTAITGAVLEACDSIDGVQDNLIENPLACHFDINSLACSKANANATTCLTADQLDAVRAIYNGPVNSCGGAEIYPGFSFGSEVEWGLQEGGLASLFSIPILQNLVYDNLDYNASTFNWDSDVGEVDKNAGAFIDEISPDLSAFRHKGGKMLVTQGWADPLNAALWPIEHLGQIQAFFRDDVRDFFELFMIPGAGHCGAASAYPQVPATYHTVEKLVKWVEKGHVPQHVLSTDPPDGSNSTRLLCPWPKTAHYVKGDIHQAASYVCE